MFKVKNLPMINAMKLKRKKDRKVKIIKLQQSKLKKMVSKKLFHRILSKLRLVI